MSGFFDQLLKIIKTIFALRDGKIYGKLDMQKTFYFAKELGLPIPFKFRWGKLGPFSYELSNVLERITSQRYIKYDGTYHYNEDDFRYVDDLKIPEHIWTFFDDINDICDENGYDLIYFIECLASLHFLNKYSGVRNKRAIFERLRDLKKDRMPFLESLLEPAWMFLEKHELIEVT